MIQRPAFLARTPSSVSLMGRVMGMDVLSEVLRAVKLEGALFFNGEFSAPWCLKSALSPAVAHTLSPGAGHLIIFHFLTEGRAYARLPEGGAKSWARAISSFFRMATSIF